MFKAMVAACCGLALFAGCKTSSRGSNLKSEINSPTQAAARVAVGQGYDAARDVWTENCLAFPAGKVQFKAPGTGLVESTAKLDIKDSLLNLAALQKDERVTPAEDFFLKASAVFLNGDSLAFAYRVEGGNVGFLIEGNTLTLKPGVKEKVQALAAKNQTSLAEAFAATCGTHVVRAYGIGALLHRRLQVEFYNDIDAELYKNIKTTALQSGKEVREAILTALGQVRFALVRAEGLQLGGKPGTEPRFSCQLTNPPSGEWEPDAKKLASCLDVVLNTLNDMKPFGDELRPYQDQQDEAGFTQYQYSFASMSDVLDSGLVKEFGLGTVAFNRDEALMVAQSLLASEAEHERLKIALAAPTRQLQSWSASLSRDIQEKQALLKLCQGVQKNAAACKEKVAAASSLLQARFAFPVWASALDFPRVCSFVQGIACGNGDQRPACLNWYKGLLKNAPATKLELDNSSGLNALLDLGAVVQAIDSTKNVALEGIPDLDCAALAPAVAGLQSLEVQRLYSSTVVRTLGQLTSLEVRDGASLDNALFLDRLTLLEISKATINSQKILSAQDSLETLRLPSPLPVSYPSYTLAAMPRLATADFSGHRSLKGFELTADLPALKVLNVRKTAITQAVLAANPAWLSRLPNLEIIYGNAPCQPTLALGSRVVKVDCTSVLP